MAPRTTTQKSLQPKLQIQLYLTANVQRYFGIPESELSSDSDIPLSSDWKALWRCSHLISTEDEQEHLFLLTNAVTHYSIILVDSSKDIASFLGQFQQHLLLALEENGVSLPSSALAVDVQLITGEPPRLSDVMAYKTDYAIELLLTNDVDVEATEDQINHHENLDFPISAADTVKLRSVTVRYEETAEVIEFPKSEGCSQSST